MTGLVRKATLLTVAGLVAASASFAGVPSPANSTVPACVPLVGSSLGVVDAAGAISITVRDLANNPLNGASVVIDLSGCTDLAICSDQLDAGALVNCAAKTTRKFTDAAGVVSFTVLGGSNGSGNATTLMNGARIYANGVLIGSPTASAYDLDGAAGVAINDLSAWLSDFGSGNAYGRADYDCSGSVAINDLSSWLTLFGAGASLESCVTACP
jgi:hypothetical protein